jgi:hypothetical protein
MVGVALPKIGLFPPRKDRAPLPERLRFFVTVWTSLPMTKYPGKGRGRRAGLGNGGRGGGSQLQISRKRKRSKS